MANHSAENREMERLRRMAFLADYLATNRNGKESAIRQGVPEKSAAVVASKWLRRPEVRAEIARIDKLATERAEITIERIIVELGRIGFVDISQAYDSQGNLKPMADWPEDVRRACVGFEVEEKITEVTDDKGEGAIEVGKVRVKKVKFHDKVAAMAQLLRHFPDGYAAQRLDVKDVTNHAEQLDEARAYRAKMQAERERLELEQHDAQQKQLAEKNGE
jgi:phage terminase small subunit